MSHKLVSLYIGDGEYYTRTDADAVIKELKAQKAQAEDDCAYWKMSEGNAVNAMHETEEYAMQLYNELRHHKYKRCLAMADACRGNFLVAEHMIEKEPKNLMWHKRHKHYGRWMMLWRCFAEQFKEEK